MCCIEWQQMRWHPIRKNVVCQDEEFGPYSLNDGEHLHIYEEEINECRIKAFC